MNSFLFDNIDILKNIISFQISKPIYIRVLEKEASKKIFINTWKNITIEKVIDIIKWNVEIDDMVDICAYFGNFSVIPLIYKYTHLRGSVKILKYAIKYNSISTVKWFYQNIDQHKLEESDIKYIKILFSIISDPSCSKNYLDIIDDDYYGLLLVKYALKNDKKDIVKNIIDYTLTKKKSDIFHYICENLDLEIIEYIYNNCPEITFKDYLCDFWEKKKYEIIKYIIQKEKIDNSYLDDFYYHPNSCLGDLHLHIRKMDYDDIEIFKLLHNNGVNDIRVILSFGWDNEDILISCLEYIYTIRQDTNIPEEDVGNTIFFDSMLKFNSLKVKDWYFKKFKYLNLSSNSLDLMLTRAIKKKFDVIVSYIIDMKEINITSQHLYTAFKHPNINILTNLLENIENIEEFITDNSRFDLPLDEHTDENEFIQILKLLKDKIKLNYYHYAYISIRFKKYNIFNYIYNNYDIYMSPQYLPPIIVNDSVEILKVYLEKNCIFEDHIEDWIKESIDLGAVEVYKYLSKYFDIKDDEEKKNNLRKSKINQQCIKCAKKMRNI